MGYVNPYSWCSNHVLIGLDIDDWFRMCDDDDGDEDEYDDDDDGDDDDDDDVFVSLSLDSR